MSPSTLRTEVADGDGSIVLTRAAEYNTITPELRDELAAAIREHDADPAVRVILLRAEGPRAEAPTPAVEAAEKLVEPLGA